MWESLPQVKAPRSRRRALAIAVSTHAAVIAIVLVFSEWKVEAVSPPETRPTYWIPVTLPSSGGSESGERTPPKKRASKPQSPPAAVKQPIQIAAALEPARPIVEHRSGDPAVPGEDTRGGGGESVIGSMPSEPSPDPVREPDPPADVVYKVAAIDVVPARSLDCREPEYSALARSMGVQGEVVIAAVIGLDGRASDVVVVSGSPILARLATEAIANCRFAPAELRGHPVRSEYRQTVTFQLR